MMFMLKHEMLFLNAFRLRHLGKPWTKLKSVFSSLKILSHSSILKQRDRNILRINGKSLNP